MLVTNQTSADIYFGPLHLSGGIGQQLTIDDTTATSLYLTDDGVADTVNNAYVAGNITVSSQAQPFPRPTGVPQLLHGSGSPEGIVYAPQGSCYLRRDGTGANNLYTKTTGVTLNTGWQNYTTTATGPGTTYRKTTALTVNNTTTETDLLNGEITIGAGVLGSTGKLRLSASGDWNGNPATTGPRFKLKLGGTVLFDTGALPSNGPPNSRFPWAIRAEIMNLGAAGSQAVTVWVDSIYGTTYSGNATIVASGTWTTGEGYWLAAGVQNAPCPVYGVGFNTSTVDTSAACALVLSVINASATSPCDTKLYSALVEII